MEPVEGPTVGESIIVAATTTGRAGLEDTVVLAVGEHESRPFRHCQRATAIISSPSNVHMRSTSYTRRARTATLILP